MMHDEFLAPQEQHNDKNVKQNLEGEACFSLGTAYARGVVDDEAQVCATTRPHNVAPPTFATGLAHRQRVDSGQCWMLEERRRCMTIFFAFPATSCVVVIHVPCRTHTLLGLACRVQVCRERVSTQAGTAW